METGTRNRLVHTPRSSKRTRSLPILNADADSLFEAVSQFGKALRFSPSESGRNLPLFDADGEGDRPDIAASTAGLQTNLEQEALEKRPLSIYRDAKTAEEEQGINILFLAIGFLRWYEDDRSEVRREAPLLMVSVSLVRDQRRSTFLLKGRDEDIATNQAIQGRLRADFGITLPDIAEAEEWRPSDYFSAVKQAIAAKPSKPKCVRRANEPPSRELCSG